MQPDRQTETQQLLEAFHEAATGEALPLQPSIHMLEHVTRLESLAVKLSVQDLVDLTVCFRLCATRGTG